MSPKLMRTLSSRSSRRCSLTPTMPTRGILSRKSSLVAPPRFVSADRCRGRTGPLNVVITRDAAAQGASLIPGRRRTRAPCSFHPPRIQGMDSCAKAARSSGSGCRLESRPTPAPGSIWKRKPRKLTAIPERTTCSTTSTTDSPGLTTDPSTGNRSYPTRTPSVARQR